MLDVAVVGAGIAGIVAARNLKEKGYSVELFEGRSRIGGRFYSTSEGIELGCSVLTGPSPAASDASLWSFSEVSKMPVERGGETAMWAHDGRFLTFDKPTSPIALASLASKRFSEMHGFFPEEARVGSLVDSEDLSCILQSWYSAITGDPHTPASIACTDEIYAYHGLEECRVVPSMLDWVRCLSAGLIINLNSPIRSISELPNETVLLKRENGLPPVQARKAIVTVPPSVVARGGLEVKPSRLALAKRLGVTNACVAIVRLSEKLRKAIFFYCDDPCLCLVFGGKNDNHLTITGKGPGSNALTDPAAIFAIMQALPIEGLKENWLMRQTITHSWADDRWTSGGFPLASAKKEDAKAWLEPDRNIAWASDVFPGGVSLVERTVRAANNASSYISMRLASVVRPGSDEPVLLG